MVKIQCLNCKKSMTIKEVKIGLEVNCECGCKQRCLDIDEHISRWKIINPFSFEDKEGI